MLRLIKFSVVTIAVSAMMTLPGYGFADSGSNHSTQTTLTASNHQVQQHTGAAASQENTNMASANNHEPSCTLAYSQAYGDCANTMTPTVTSDLGAGGGAGGR